MEAASMKRDMKVRCGDLGVVTLVAPVGPHAFSADGSALTVAIRGADEIVEPEKRDRDGTVTGPAVTRERWTEGGLPPERWIALTEQWELRAVDPALCEPL
jgi:hypothetical protein